jgi:hypothetical protein
MAATLTAARCGCQLLAYLDKHLDHLDTHPFSTFQLCMKLQAPLPQLRWWSLCIWVHIVHLFEGASVQTNFCMFLLSRTMLMCMNILIPLTSSICVFCKYCSLPFCSWGCKEGHWFNPIEIAISITQEKPQPQAKRSWEAQSGHNFAERKGKNRRIPSSQEQWWMSNWLMSDEWVIIIDHSYFMLLYNAMNIIYYVILYIRIYIYTYIHIYMCVTCCMLFFLHVHRWFKVVMQFRVQSYTEWHVSCSIRHPAQASQQPPQLGCHRLARRVHRSRFWDQIGSDWNHVLTMELSMLFMCFPWFNGFLICCVMFFFIS